VYESTTPRVGFDAFLGKEVCHFFLRPHRYRRVSRTEFLHNDLILHSMLNSYLDVMGLRMTKIATVPIIKIQEACYHQSSSLDNGWHLLALPYMLYNLTARPMPDKS